LRTSTTLRALKVALGTVCEPFARTAVHHGEKPKGAAVEQRVRHEKSIGHRSFGATIAGRPARWRNFGGMGPVGRWAIEPRFFPRGDRFWG
jgi:hypothetical protein